MKKFKLLTKKKIPKFRVITNKKVKSTRNSGQINLLTGKSIKRKPKEKPAKVEYLEETPIVNNIPSNLIDIIDTYPDELQQFLTNTSIISVVNTAGKIIFRLDGNFEVTVSDTTVNNRPKQLVIIKQGKNQILKHTI